MGVRKSPEETRARREEVRGFMDSIGPYSVPIKVLAEKHNVTVKVIYNDIDFWIKKINFKKIDLEGKRLLMGIKKNLALIESMRVDGSPTDKLKAIKLANETAEVYTRLMEQYGFKEKIADKMEHLGASATFNLIEKSVEEIKNAKTGSKGPRASDKPEASTNLESTG